MDEQKGETKEEKVLKTLSICFTNLSLSFHFFLLDCLHGLSPRPFLLSYSVSGLIKLALPSNFERK